MSKVVSVHHLHGGKFKCQTGSVSLKVLESAIADPEVSMITFDDGLDSQRLAFPLLKKSGKKAVFFINNTHLHEKHRILRERMGDRFYQVFQTYLTRPLTQFPPAFLKEYPFYSEIEKGYRYFRDFVNPQQHDEILRHMGANDIEPHLLTPAEIVEAGFELGLHTANHPRVLYLLKPHEQLDEWLDNLNYIRQYQKFINYAAYPYGRYDFVSIALLKTLEIMDAFTSSQTSTGTFQTPRYDITQWK